MHDVLETTLRDDQLSFRVRLAPTANLVHQLDCLAKAIPCSRSTFEQHWASRWASDDVAALEEWASIRRAYAASIELPERTPVPKTKLPLPEKSFELGKRVRMAALRANDPDAWSSSLSLLMAHADVVAMRRVHDHFSSRFEAWWRASGRSSGEAFFAELRAMLDHEGKLRPILEQAIRFYGAPLPRGTTIELDVVVVPRSAQRGSVAEQIADHSVIELREGTAAKARIGVVSHELFHFFFNSRARADEARLVERFTRSGDPLATVAYGLLDESVATFLGNGVVARALRSDFHEYADQPRSFYDDDAIDRTAKALLAQSRDLLDTRLDEDAFARLFLRAVHEAVGDDPRPMEWLRTMFVATSPLLTPARRAIIDAAHANNSTTFDLGGDAIAAFEKYEDVSGIVFMTPEETKSLTRWEAVIPRKDADAILRRAAEAPATIYGIRRSAHAYLWMFVTTPSEIDAVVARFASQKRAFVGFLP